MNRRRISKQLRAQILARDGCRCLMCGRSSGEVELEVDHVRALADGGTDEINNLATLCRDCNGGKSAYRFADYREMNLIPDGIEKHLKFIRDDRTGDYQRYHLYLYFNEGVHGGVSVEPFQHSWKITGSDFGMSSDWAALEERRRLEETKKFITEIRTELVKQRKRLVRNEEGICRVDGA